MDNLYFPQVVARVFSSFAMCPSEDRRQIELPIIYPDSSINKAGTSG
jgi:hypothetical protein